MVIVTAIAAAVAAISGVSAVAVCGTTEGAVFAGRGASAVFAVHDIGVTGKSKRAGVTLTQ